MSTEVIEVIQKAGVKSLEVLQFNFPECRNTDIAKRKGDFTLKIRNGVIDEDGEYREDPNPVKLLSVVETKTMMVDEVELSDGTVLTGAQIAEALAKTIDNAWAGDYDYTEPVEEIEETPIVEETIEDE